MTHARRKRAWSFRGIVTAALVTTAVLTFTLVGGALLVYRIPAIEQESFTYSDLMASETAELLRDVVADIAQDLQLYRQFLQEPEVVLQSRVSRYIYLIPVPIAVADYQGNFLVGNFAGDQSLVATDEFQALLSAALRREPLPETMSWQDIRVHPSVLPMDDMGWIVVAAVPSGMHNPAFAAIVYLMAGGFLGACIIGMLIAPLWARLLQRPVVALINSSTLVANGYYQQDWPSGPVDELNRLSQDLHLMADKIHQREQELSELNQRLEQRVEARTAELAESNNALSGALETLERAQEELIQSAKLAALGELVAGVAHELNTPIGNGMMAASTMEAAVRTFRKDMEEGLKRSSLDRFVEDMEQSAAIISRNLSRSVALVTNFKQVAVDRASSQRRRFMLNEIVDEVMVMMHPTLSRLLHQIDIRIEGDIQMDSYPGPLEQVLTNFIQNAIIHGFEDREAGDIALHAYQSEQYVIIRISDNGKGIPPEIIKRIFDPFFTTRLGSGGSGLGLNVVHNIVTGILGGTIRVESTLDEGTTMELSLPAEAPVPEE
ncbi:sensor histidine kinase [Nitrincola sp. MINF-07-Sa-05]|uniref:sensor histidine kinase n=1 Tax=Nitrincola salilacus TaxID=3400273 RepID=UPI003917D3B0